MKLLFLLFLITLPLFSTACTTIKLEIKGTIGPERSKYLKDGMELAVLQNTQMILIKLDTPGGLSASMREMIQEITNSAIPIITYLSPKGARTASTEIIFFMFLM